LEKEMAVYVGRIADVLVGTYSVSEMGTITMGGLTNDVIEHTSFGDTFKLYEFGMGDYGTLSFSGWYDPSDSTGQSILRSAAVNVSKLTNLYLYIDNTSFWAAKTSSVTGAILMTKVDAWTTDKDGLARIDFEAKVSGEMTLI